MGQKALFIRNLKSSLYSGPSKKFYKMYTEYTNLFDSGHEIYHVYIPNRVFVWRDRTEFDRVLELVTKDLPPKKTNEVVLENKIKKIFHEFKIISDEFERVTFNKNNPQRISIVLNFKMRFMDFYRFFYENINSREKIHEILNIENYRDFRGLRNFARRMIDLTKDENFKPKMIESARKYSRQLSIVENVHKS